MPVQSADLEAAAATYSLELWKTAGSPAVLDLMHLGLGPDGHTASLTPGDPVLQVTNIDVALTREYQSRRRMTLTYPALDRARQVLWVVTGAEKVEMLRRLYNGDRSIPAGRIRQDNALLIAEHERLGEPSVTLDDIRRFRQLESKAAGHKVTQSEVSDAFKMRATVYADFDGKPMRLGSVGLFGSQAGPEFKILLPKKPKRILLNANHDVPASSTTAEQM